MPTKYVRDWGASRDGEGRKTPFRKHLQRPATVSSRRRFMFVYAGLLGLTVFVFAASSMIRIMQYESQPILRGVGKVVGLEEGSTGGESEHLLRVRVPLGGDRWAEDTAFLDEEQWRGFRMGDSVAVLYQVSRFGVGIRIRECGLVALSPGNR